MAPITGSSLPLLRRCQWWARPEVVAPPPAPPSPEMALGTEVHSAIEAALLGWAPKLSDEARPYFDAWLAWWKTGPLGKGYWAAEQAYAYIPASDKAHKLKVKNRLYEFSAGEIPGTVDAVSVADDSAIVVDWKTGNDFQGMTADARDNWQLRLYALAVSRAHRVYSVRVVVARITPEGVRTSEHTLDALELDEIADTVWALVAAAPTAAPTPGTHCGRCKAVAVCPSTSAAQDIVVAQPAELTIASPEQATALLLRLWQVQAACEQVERVLKTYAANANEAGIPLPNGKRWVRKTVDRESFNFNGDGAAEAVAEISMAGAEAAIETKMTATKSGIEKALKASGVPAKEVRYKADELFARLRVLGVLRSTETDSYREV